MIKLRINRASRKTIYITAFAIVTVILLMVAFIFWMDFNKSQNTSTAGSDTAAQLTARVACTDDLLNRAATYIDQPDGLSLNGLSTEIDNIAGYELDPNCLYVKIQANFVSNSSTGSADIISQLDRLGADKHSFSEEFGPYVMSMQDIRSRAATLASINAGYDKAQAEYQQRMSEELQHVEGY